ncbi:helix-turn-helix domain-containing protein [Rhizobium lusitanum]|uniref:Helix-turn-helix domain-containing protein n=1 Tax=Rhizobium lusitanum TaxID=293958 RepID=A0A6L9U9P7_9HYPH|nr:helix-turn-helix domain-containing protein [Rhizobium lusitanum]NEI71016.1 helix-turn-helix domain-containing protein [Rhizobium lusitanum]
MKNSAHPVDVTVGANVRRIRVAMGLSQEKLAEQLGVTFQQVQKYEKGTNRISASRLVLIAGALRVDINDLFAGANVENASPIAPRLSRDALRIAEVFDKIKNKTSRQSVMNVVRVVAASHDTVTEAAA